VIRKGIIQDVFNMVVEKTKNFACEGVFLHNCDAFRYGIYGITERYGFATQAPRADTAVIQTLHYQDERPFIWRRNEPRKDQTIN